MLQKTQNLDIAENLSFMKHCKVSCKQLDVTLLDLLLNTCGTALQNQHGIHFSSEVFSHIHITSLAEECHTLAVCTFCLPVCSSDLCLS